MLRLIFTCDYEIHGDGRGSPHQLMVEPVNRLFRQLDACGARLTLMCEAAEVMRFRQHRNETSRDEFGYAEIANQLQEIVVAGHDVQLHLHPEYLTARRNGDGWEVEAENASLANLPRPRLHDAIGAGKVFLQELLEPIAPAYRCIAFRAGSWSMQPSRAAVDALVSNGITVDTSVFKYGLRRGSVEFDYSSAPSRLLPWPVDPDDICRPRPGSALIEFPIYAENRPIWSFVSPGRLHRILQDHSRSAESWGHSPGNPLGRRAWKADFNQCTGRQLIRALERAEARYGDSSRELPFVLIGHSKLFSRRNERALAPFLAFVAAHPDRFAFGTFADFDFESFRHDVPTS